MLHKKNLLFSKAEILLLRCCLTCHKVNLQDGEKVIINSYMLPLPIFYEIPLNCCGEKQITKKFLKQSRGKFRFVNVIPVGMQLLVALERFPKKHRDVYRTRNSSSGTFLALVSSFQPLSSFPKNPIIGAMGVLNAPLEHYNVFWNLSRWSNY